MTEEASGDRRRGEGNPLVAPGPAERADSSLLRILLHDLQNPLHAAATNLALARQDVDHERLEAAAAALDRMDALLEELPRLSSIGDPVENPELVRLGAVARRCWQPIDPDRARLVVADDCEVEAEPARFGQLLENLFRNAVEHAAPEATATPSADGEPEGTPLTVTVGALDRRRGFYVEDDGEGIPLADREKVTERGYSTRDGTGFGLFVVREVAAAHGWDLRVTSSADGGARFEFLNVTLPTDGRAGGV